MTSLPFHFLVAGGVAAIAAWLATVMRFSNARFIVAFMLFTAANGVRLSPSGNIGNLGWLTPFQLARSEVFLACGALLWLCLLTNLSRAAFNRLPALVWFLFIIGFYQGMLRFIHESPVAGVQSLVFTGLTIVPLAVTITSLIRQNDDAVPLVRMIMWANVLYLACCIVSLVLNPETVVVTRERRFMGLASQPVTASISLAMGCVGALWLLLHDPQWRYRWLWMALIGVNGILAVGTGSRTGILLMLVGLAAILYRRLGRIVLVAPIGAASVMLMLTIMQNWLDIDLAFSRTTQLEDTRTRVWATLLEEGLANPLIGLGTGAHSTSGASESENSYLYGFAAFGIGMLSILLLFSVTAMVHGLNALRASMHVRAWRPRVDLALGLMGAYFVLTPLDGVMLSRVDQMMILLTIGASITTHFLSGVRSGEIPTDELPDFLVWDDEDEAAAFEPAEGDADYAIR